MRKHNLKETEASWAKVPFYPPILINGTSKPNVKSSMDNVFKKCSIKFKSCLWYLKMLQIERLLTVTDLDLIALCVQDIYLRFVLD